MSIANANGSRVCRLLVLGLTVQTVACAVKEKPEAARAAGTPKGPSMEAKQLAANEQAPHVAELTFAKGKSALIPTAQKQLDALVREVRAHLPKQVDGKDREKAEVEFKIVTWSDEEYPSVHAKKLNTDQRELANHRNEAIKTYLKQKGIVDEIEVFNMAERPGALSEWLNTSGARIKKALEVAGVPNTNTNVKTPPKASKSIVMAIPHLPEE